MRPIDAAPTDPNSEVVRRLAALTADATANLPATLREIEALHAAAQAAALDARAVVLAALGGQLVISEFASLAAVPAWAVRVDHCALEPRALETHAALIYCAGVLALRQFGSVANAPGADECVAAYRDRLLSATGALDPTIAVSTAEHVASWMTNTGQHAAFDQLSAIVERYLDAPALAPRVRARWLFWLGANQMHADQRAAAEATWARAQQAPETAHWDWLRFHLERTAIRPVIEDGRYDEAGRRLEALRLIVNPAHPLDLADYHHLRGWLALATGDARLARQHYELAVESAARGALPDRIASMYRSALAISLAAAGDEDAAEQIVERLEFLPGPRGLALRAANLALIRACRARRLGAEDYVQRLTEGVQAAREQGLLRFFRLAPPLAAQLCADALTHGVETEFVRKAIAARGLPPPADADDRWPWKLKLYTLRPFELQIDEAPFDAQGKTRTKPLALLKLLAAQGGGPIAISRVTDWLWPDQDPVQARGSFDVTINRLRTMLRYKEALVVGEGKVGLEPALVWVDTRAFESLARRCAEPTRARSSERARLFHRLADLYRQPFLQLDEEEPWTVEARQRYAALWSTSVEALARAAEADGAREEAAWMRERAAVAHPPEARLRLIVNR
jgi:DNA-binding SARP family transcriptional activator